MCYDRPPRLPRPSMLADRRLAIGFHNSTRWVRALYPHYLATRPDGDDDASQTLFAATREALATARAYVEGEKNSS